MINPFRTLSSQLPERTPAGKDALSTDPKRLKVWVDELPRANQQLSLQQLTQALHDFRSRSMEGFARLEAMEILRPLLMEGIGTLSTRLQGSTFPLNEQKTQMARQLLSLQRELALAYRMSVVEACGPTGKVPFLRGGQVATALVRAMYHHVRWLGACYFLYRMPEQGVWMQIYALAAFADSHGLADKSIEDAVEKRALTVTLLQNQSVMMSLANPYRFSQRELVELWNLTRDTAALIELTPQRFAAAGALALIDYDLPPSFAARAPDPQEGDVLWIDLRKLDKLIRSALTQSGEASEVSIRLTRDYQLILPRSLLTRALEGWNQDISRTNERLVGDYELDSVVGLSSLHFQLAENNDFDTFMRDVRGISSVGVDRASWAVGNADLSRIASAKAKVLDQSLGGYRLRWEADQGVRARIGELVGLSTPLVEAETRDWLLGIVRWLRYDEYGAIEAGVDLIARRALPAGLRALDATGAGSVPVRAIRLAAMLNHTEVNEVFLMASASALSGEVMEVSRHGDRWDFTEGESAKVYNCGQLRALEALGDYVLVTADRI